MRKICALIFSGLLLAGCGVTIETADETTEVATPEAEAPSVVEETADPALVTSSGFAGTWPFGVDEALIICLDSGGLGVELDGEEYGLNGPAISAGYEELTLETPDSVWLDNPDTGAKVNIRDFSKLASEFCSG
jgi:hypothetical protein